VKFGRQKIGEIVRYLQDKKFRLPLRLSLLRGSRQNLPGPARNNVLRVLYISSKSVYLRRSFSRMREHHHNPPESESNIRLKPSFEPNNNDCIIAEVQGRASVVTKTQSCATVL